MGEASVAACHKCGWHLRKSDCATIEDGITHCICYNCGQEWVEWPSVHLKNFALEEFPNAKELVVEMTR